MIRYWLAACVLLSPLASSSTLTFLNWEDYLSDNLVQQWQSQNGHTIKQIPFDNDQTRDDILTKAAQIQLDLVIIDEINADIFGTSQQLVALDESNVPNLINMDTFWRRRCGDYGVPYLWGSLGLLYRTDKISQPKSWSALLNPAPSLKQHISLIEDNIDMLAPALISRGLSINTTDEAELKLAYQDLLNISSDVLTFQYPISFIQESEQADELWLAAGYQGDEVGMNDILEQEGLWQFVVPEEGTVLWVDCLSLSTHSQHQELALNFINFLLAQSNAHTNAVDVGFLSPLKPELLPEAADPEHNKAISNLFEKGQFYHPISAKDDRVRNRIVEAVIKAHETQ